jgi:hypothetical protein
MRKLFAIIMIYVARMLQIRHLYRIDVANMLLHLTIDGKIMGNRVFILLIY